MQEESASRQTHLTVSVPLRRRTIFEHGSVGSSEDRPALVQIEPEASWLVHQPVVAPAQEQQVLERRRTAIGPVDNVVGVAPGMWTVAAGEAAPAIPGDHGSAHRWGHDRGPTADV